MSSPTVKTASEYLSAQLRPIVERYRGKPVPASFWRGERGYEICDVFINCKAGVYLNGEWMPDEAALRAQMREQYGVEVGQISMERITTIVSPKKDPDAWIQADSRIAEESEDLLAEIRYTFSGARVEDNTRYERARDHQGVIRYRLMVLKESFDVAAQTPDGLVWILQVAQATVAITTHGQHMPPERPLGKILFPIPWAWRQKYAETVLEDVRQRLGVLKEGLVVNGQYIGRDSARLSTMIKETYGIEIVFESDELDLIRPTMSFPNTLWRAAITADEVQEGLQAVTRTPCQLRRHGRTLMGNAVDLSAPDLALDRHKPFI